MGFVIIKTAAQLQILKWQESDYTSKRDKPDHMHIDLHTYIKTHAYEFIIHTCAHAIIRGFLNICGHMPMSKIPLSRLVNSSLSVCQHSQQVVAESREIYVYPISGQSSSCAKLGFWIFMKSSVDNH